MIVGRAAGLKSRIGRRHRREQGLTIIELLLSLSLLILITGFLAGGLQMARRAFDADRQAAVASEADQAIEVLLNQIAAAFPLTDSRTGKLHFDGRSNAIAFASLDQGRANRAGLRHAVIQQVDTELTISLTSPTAGQRADPSGARHQIVLLSRIAEIRFAYYGASAQAAAPAWRPDWSAMDRLPDLVSIRIGYKDPTLAPASVLVALRQRR
jgi:general secretion pathway protein J